VSLKKKCVDCITGITSTNKIVPYHSNDGAILLRVCVAVEMLLHSNEHLHISTVADWLSMFATCGGIPWKAPTSCIKFFQILISPYTLYELINIIILHTTFTLRIINEISMDSIQSAYVDVSSSSTSGFQMQILGNSVCSQIHHPGLVRFKHSYCFVSDFFPVIQVPAIFNSIT
jgi:hypothetical protein